MKKYVPLTVQEIRSFRARDINSLKPEQDHDYHRQKLQLADNKKESLVRTIAALNGRIAELNVEIMRLKAAARGSS